MEELAVGQRTLATQTESERASWRKREREREGVRICVRILSANRRYKRGAGGKREREGGKAGGWLCIYINT